MYKGSYTVEASLLMVIILPILTGLLYLGFYLHDSAVLQNAAYETAVCGSLFQEEEEQKSIVESKKQEMISRCLIRGSSISGRVEIGETAITVSYQGKFAVPGLVMRFFAGNQLKLEAKSRMLLVQPRKTITRIQGIEKIMKGNNE